MDFIINADLAVLDFIREHFSNPVLDMFFKTITMFGEAGIFFIAVALVMVCFKKTRKTGFMLGAALAIGFLIGNLGIKPLVARVRPYEYDGRDIALIIEKLDDYSFPSGHTLAAFEAATVLMIRDRKHFGIAALVLAVLIAMSRLYLYVHYPSDVIGGAILGTIFGILGVLLVNFVYKKITDVRTARLAK